MGFRQLVAPNLETKDDPGWCLRFVGNAFNTKPRPSPDAWHAWKNAKHQHTDGLPNVAVPVFFYWYGTIDKVTKNWGDVAIWVPGRGVFGTPLRGSGKSNRWDPDVASRARAIGGQSYYVGWTEDLNTVKLVERIIANNTPKETIEMIANTDQATKIYKMLRPNGNPSQNEISQTAGKRTFAEFLNSAQTEVELRDRADREKTNLIKALQNDLNTMKAQADELKTRPTKQAFDELHTNLTVCSAGATAQMETITKYEKELADSRLAKPTNDFIYQIDTIFKKLINKVKAIIK